jgi:hypothetical protein
MEVLIEILFEIVGGLLWALLEGVFVAILEVVVDTVQWIWRGLRGRRDEAVAPEPVEAKSEPASEPVVSAVVETAVVTRGDDDRILLGLAFSAVLGIAAGWLSLWLLPNHVLASPLIRVAMVPVSAIFCALAVPEISSLLGRSAGASSFAIARPRNAFALAFAFALTRLLGGR